MKNKTTVTILVTAIITFIVASVVYIPAGIVLAEQSGNTPNSGVVSRIKSVYDSLVGLGHGSDGEGSWGNWGSMWNRIRSAGEWAPNGNASESEVVAGKTYYKDSRTAKTGTLELTGDALTSEVVSGKTFYSNSFTKLTGTAPAPFDYSTQSKVTWDDYKNGDSADGDSAGEESSWTNTAGSATTGVWKDERTGLYWSADQGGMINPFTVATCDYFSTSPRSSYAGSDSDCGDAINYCATLNLGSGGTSSTDWYLPSQKELMQAYLNGIYNQTNTDFVSHLNFWSSTENGESSGFAWAPYLYSGMTYSYDSVDGFNIRCVRRD